MRTLSPLAGFLGRWGLSAADEDKVIDAVIASVKENIITDMKARGTDPRFGLKILNSRDNPDPLNATPNLMDAGGAFPGLFGVGPDNAGGTADDFDYDFGEDEFYPDEGLAGTEDTLNTAAWGLVKGKAK